MAKRTIMRRFRIHEISAVDEPAQQGAKALLMKRRDSTSPRLAAVAAHQAEVRQQRHDDVRLEAVRRHQSSNHAEA